MKNRILTYLKTALVRYPQYLRKYTSNYYFYVVSGKQELASSKIGRTILFDIKSKIYRDRNLASFIYWLVEYGYDVHIKGSVIGLRNLGFYGRKLLSLRSVKIVHKKQPEYFAVFTDNRSEKNPDAIVMKEEYIPEYDNNSVHIPLGLHPNTYFNGYTKDVDKIDISKKRKIKVFFSGSLNESIYDNDIIKNRYAKLSRLRIFNTLKNSRINHSILFSGSREDIENIGKSYKIVFHDRDGYKIPRTLYLDLLANSDFFLFTPGVTYPNCHNNFEAIFAGAIPILQYPEYFIPRLEHSKNCIVFEDENDLIDKLEYIFTLDDAKVTELRKNVVMYYNSYQSPFSIVKNVSDKIEKDTLRQIYFRIQFENGFLYK